MPLLDVELLGDELASLIREHVASQVAPLAAQVATLKAQIAGLPQPKDGKDGRDAKEIDVEDVARRAAALIPQPKDGKDADPEFIKREITTQVSAIPKPADGKSVDMAALFLEIGRAVKQAVEAQPKALNGKDGTNGKDGRDGIDGKDGPAGKDGANGLNGKDGADGLNGKDGEQGLAGKDGLNGKDGANGRDGIDGKNGDVGLAGKDGRDGIDGKNGADGINGKDADPALIERLVDLAVAKIPPAKDGKSIQPETVTAMVRAEVERAMATIQLPEDGQDGRDGKDGRDGANGFGFDDIDFSASLKGERTLSIALRSGGREIVREVKMPIPVYKGVHRPGVAYEKSDCVTHGGSLWIASKDTSATPKNGDDSDWRLSVKRGRDGTDLDRS